MYTKPPAKKSSASKKSTKRKTTKTRKAKVYIPASKVIVFCGVIIAVCMCLLLVTTVKTHSDDEQNPVSQRFEKEEAKTPEESQKSQNNQTKAPVETQKTQKNQTKTPAKSPETKKAPAEPPKPQKNQTKTPEDSPKSQKTPAESAKPQKTPAESPKSTVSNPTEKSTKYNFPKAVNGAQLIFVFDDAGQNNSHLEKFMSLPFPITVAVLPQLPSSVAAADRVRRSGNEVILHQPMQSVSAKVNPGPGAITPDMDEAQIITQLFLNINEIGPVSGMNNHEGSAITADAEKMAIILQTASENGIYFLDSRTNVETKVPYVAGELGYSYYERNIFLDNEKTETFALKELRRGLDIANKNGNVIMIGHIWSADFLPQFLQKVYPELKAAGYTFSTVGNSRAQK